MMTPLLKPCPTLCLLDYLHLSIRNTVQSKMSTNVQDRKCPQTMDPVLIQTTSTKELSSPLIVNCFGSVGSQPVSSSHLTAAVWCSYMDHVIIGHRDLWPHHLLYIHLKDGQDRCGDFWSLVLSFLWSTCLSLQVSWTTWAPATRCGTFCWFWCSTGGTSRPASSWRTDTLSRVPAPPNIHSLEELDPDREQLVPPVGWTCVNIYN